MLPGSLSCSPTTSNGENRSARLSRLARLPVGSTCDQLRVMYSRYARVLEPAWMLQLSRRSGGAAGDAGIGLGDQGWGTGAGATLAAAGAASARSFAIRKFTVSSIPLKLR